MRVLANTIWVCLVFCVVLAVPFGSAQAQTSGVSSEGPTQITTSSGQTRRFPSIFGAASAFPSVGGTGFVALTYVNPRQGESGAGGDGDAVVGYTIGNPIENLSATFGLAITSLKEFGDSGSASLSLSRALAVNERSLTFLGVSASNLAAWGDAELTPESHAIYVSHLFAIPSGDVEIPVQVSAGYGDQITFDKTGSRVDEGAFVGVGVGVGRNLSLSLSATKTQFNAGISFSVPGLQRSSVSLGVLDITDNVDRRQFVVSVSYAF